MRNCFTSFLNKTMWLLDLHLYQLNQALYGTFE